MKSRWVGVLILALAVGLIALSCKKSSNPAGPGPVTPDVTVNILGNALANSFSPDTVTVTVGQTVAWHNQDGITHTSTANGVGLWNTGNIAPGGTSAAVQMNTTGTLGYHCNIHPSMVGAVKVNP